MPQPERVSILDPAVAGVEELQFDRGRSVVTKRRRDPRCLHIEVPLGRLASAPSRSGRSSGVTMAR